MLSGRSMEALWKFTLYCVHSPICTYIHRDICCWVDPFILWCILKTKKFSEFLSPTHARIRAGHLQHFLFLSLGLASFSLQSIESNVSPVVWAESGR